MKAIVVGTGRCGTGYMAQVITRAGLKCGHEAVFGPKGMTWIQHQDADSSWLAVPHLEWVQKHHPEVTIILIHRHPRAVIESFIGIDFFLGAGHVLYREFMYAHAPEMAGMQPLEAACYHYVNWNLRALEHADIVGDVEALPWERIRPALGVDWNSMANAVLTTNTTINHRTRATLDSDVFPQEVWDTWEKLNEAAT